MASNLDGWVYPAIPFVGGLDTKAATAVVPPDRLAVLENGVFTKQGAVAKRAGYSAVPDYAVVGTIDGARRGLTDANGAAALVTDRRVYTRTNGLWESRGRYAGVTYRAAEVAYANKNQSAADAATTNGVTAVVWKYATNSLYFQLFDEGDRPLCAITALATATADYPSALAVGDNILLFYADTSTNTLKARIIRTNDVAASVATASVVDVRTDLTAERLYSVAPGEGSTGLVTWEGNNTAGVNGVGVAHVNAFGAVSSVVTATADATALPPAVAYNSRSNTVCVAWAKTGGNVEFRQFAWSNLAAASAETDSTVGTAGRVAVAPTEDDTSYAAGKHFALAIESTLGASDDLDIVTLVTTGSVTTTEIRHSHLASRGFALARQGCFMLGHESRTGLQNGYYLYAADGYLVGAFEQATALDRSASPELPGCSGGALALGFARALDVDKYKAQYTHSGIRLLRFNDSGRVSTAKLGQSTYLSGCQLWAFDGEQPVEAGFHMFPDVKLGGSGASAGDFTADNINGESLLDGVQYNYRFYYEWYNARGERCRSLPIQRSFTPSFASGEGEITIALPTLRHTLKSATYGRQAEVSIVVYRSEGNESSVFYRVSSPDPSTAGSDNGYVPNSFSADSVNWTDSMADAAIVDNERDMFSVAELLAAPIPGPELVFATGDRLYLAGGAIPRGSVLPSKQHLTGEMVEVASELETRPCTNRVTALGAVNETVVVFTEREIFLASGPGFDNAGGGQAFGTGRVTTDVGCTQPGSVVMVPGGLLFKSAKGIYALGQDFSVQYVGAPVERYNAQTIKAACVVPDTNQVVFLSEDGYTLMFDYFYGAWGTFTQHLGVDSCVVGDDYFYLRNDGIVYERDASSYTDAGAPIILKVRTGRFRGEALQHGLEMPLFGILGEYKSPHKLKVRLYYDRNEFWSSERTINVDEIIDNGTWGSSATWGSDDFWGGSGGITDYRFKVRPRRTKFSQIAFEFEDVITAEAGASFELTELVLKVRPMGGIQSTSAARKV